MANIFDYLAWRGDLRFAQSPFNPADNIIFSQLAYLPLDGIVPGIEEKQGISIARAAEIFSRRLKCGEPDSIQSKVIFKDDPAFISALASSDRFKDCELCGFVNHVDEVQEKQFAAFSVITGKNSSFIVFRGTDASIVGWKEDFNMSFCDAIPAQIEAVSYLEKMSGRLCGALRIGGHSKGGNLAVYAAAFCRDKTRRRITEIYSNDAPGFQRRVIESEGFLSVRERIQFFVPQSSVIGMLFEHGGDYAVVKSSQSGLMQHDLYSWEVTHNDLARLNEVTRESRFVDKTIREWIGGLDTEHRRQFVDALYTILSAAQVSSFPELSADWFNAALKMIQSLGTIDESGKAVIGQTLAALFRAAKNNIATLLPPYVGQPAMINIPRSKH